MPQDKPAQRDKSSHGQGNQAWQIPPRSFRGCWTCRDRRVKCDERRPKCHRCLQSGRHCQGYGVRLNWSPSRQYQGSAKSTIVEQSGVRSPFIFQSSVDLSTITNISPSESSHEPSLESIEAARSVGSPREEPAFTLTKSINTPGHVPTPLDTPSGLTQRGEDLSNTSGLLFFQNESHSQLRRHQVDTTEWGSLEATSPVAGLDSQALEVGREHGTASTSSTNGENGTTESSTSRHPPEKNYSTPPTIRHIDFLSMPSRQKSLIFHWVTWLSGKLMLTDGPDNVLRTALLPRALSGVSGSSTQSTADIAVFHAICAGSAFNLFELSGRKDTTLEALALNHERLELEHLRFNLGRQDVLGSQSLGLAIMASITVDAISGITGRWKTHLSGGISYLRHLQRHRRLAEDDCGFPANILRMALLCHWNVPGERPSDCQTGREVDIFELQLYLSFPPAQCSRGISLDSHTAVASHAARAFYYASLVYFQRTIRRASPGAVHSLVNIGFRELEAIETLTEGTAGCMALWPALVLGSEASTREMEVRVRTWFQAKEAFGVRNVCVIHDLIEDLWLRRARDRDLGWQDLIAEEKYDVFRL
ncbi:hypothetical protein EDB81DRAFT_899148 [Dactylonectria macrodidyma]|uniref:Zn(2)-C6 fungal-type domain-containing protein n=1 Tax=Dactylonectria macrodidyma TaxID=307937 RepID=A0A9P9EQA0_9HYPO|nr:hypothetical protein EDB81DRAFT_899148 [Dactylonectria macrodidyma]